MSCIRVIDVVYCSKCQQTIEINTANYAMIVPANDISAISY